MWAEGGGLWRTATLDAIFLTERTLSVLRVRVDAELSCTLVAFEAASSRLVGICMCRTDEAYQLCAAREARGSGIADELTAAAEVMLNRGGSKRAILYCFPTNARSRRFYNE